MPGVAGGAGVACRPRGCVGQGRVLWSRPAAEQQAGVRAQSRVEPSSPVSLAARGGPQSEASPCVCSPNPVQGPRAACEARPSSAPPACAGGRGDGAQAGRACADGSE